MGFKIGLALFFFFQSAVWGAPIEEKVLICGVCRNIEHAVPNTIRSIEELGAQFKEYRVIIYENNSKDKTRALLKRWADWDYRVTFLSETVTKEQLISPIHGKKMKRTEQIARARNKVLDIVMLDRFNDYKYVIWADLDFLRPWDVPNVVDSIVNPEQEWDAIFANGVYDLFAYRDAQAPIGAELMGDLYWRHIGRVLDSIQLDQNSPWKRVYSAFGGLAIYKREAMRGCRYSGLVTKDLETVICQWLEKADDSACFYEDYKKRVAHSHIIDLTANALPDKLPFGIVGVRLFNQCGIGKLVWFSASSTYPLPWTCEHISFHASMALRGHDKFYMNPRLISTPN